MSREEAISLLTQVNKILVNSNSWLENTHEPLNMAFDMAIKALEQEPTANKNLEVDCISRQQAIDAFPDLLPNMRYNKKAITEILQKVPPVTPQEPRWISVSERLPTKEEFIANNGLFIVSDGNRTYVEIFDVYNPIKHFCTMNGFRVDRCVTAWMPLPKPYKAEREG